MLNYLEPGGAGPTTQRHSAPARGLAPRGSVPGFTLIELLIVIAIIGLLISILMPSLGAAKRRTQSMVCQANLRTLSQAIEMYFQRDSAYPNSDAFPNVDSLNDNILTHSSCLPYRVHSMMPGTPTKIMESWYCPVKGAIPKPDGLRQGGHGTYLYNRGDLYLMTINGVAVRANPSKLSRTADIGVLRDYTALDRIAGAAMGETLRKAELRFGADHFKGQNIAYLDGHVEFSKDKRWMDWGPDTANPIFPTWRRPNLLP